MPSGTVKWFDSKKGFGFIVNAEGKLRETVAQIKAIDHHAHPVRPTAAGEAPDTDYDALPVESLAPQSDPIRMRADSSVIAEAHRLFGGKKPNPVALLDQLGIESMFANRVTMGRGLPSPRFLWVPFDDALLFPLDNTGMERPNGDDRAFYGAVHAVSFDA